MSENGPAKKSAWRVVIPLAILVAGAGGLWWWLGGRSGGALTATVGKRTLRREVHAGGKVEPARNPVNIPSRSGGIVKSLDVPESSLVIKGQQLATLLEDEARAQLRIAQSDLAAAKANEGRLMKGARPEEVRGAKARVTEAESAAAAAHENRVRMDALFASQSITATAHDEAVRAEETANARMEDAKRGLDLTLAGARAEELRGAHAGVEAAEARLSLAQMQIEQRTIVAPFDGTVLAFFVAPGMAISPGQPVALVADLSVLQVRAEVDELSMGLVKPGQRACTRSDAFPGVEFCGEVKDVAKALGRRHFGGGSPGGHTEDVKIVEITCSLPAGDSRLVSGQSVETIIQVATKEDVLAVPEAALKERNGEVFARLQTGSKVEERLIEAGASDGMFREVKAGLAAGDRVVIER